MAVLEVRDLRKNFGNLEVLKGISFSLEKGESVAVIGSAVPQLFGAGRQRHHFRKRQDRL